MERKQLIIYTNYNVFYKIKPRLKIHMLLHNLDIILEVIALGQMYFAIQIRRQEIEDYFNKLNEDNISKKYKYINTLEEF